MRLASCGHSFFVGAAGSERAEAASGPAGPHCSSLRSRDTLHEFRGAFEAVCAPESDTRRIPRVNIKVNNFHIAQVPIQQALNGLRAKSLAPMCRIDIKLPKVSLSSFALGQAIPDCLTAVGNEVCLVFPRREPIAHAVKKPITVKPVMVA